MDMHLASVNRALPKRVRLGERAIFTAIRKEPASGPVTVTTSGLEGDGVGSPEHHGGPDQALYVYGRDDYDWWTAELARPLSAGTFGENLTIAGLTSATLAIGDRLAIGDDVILEVTAPRIPCGTLAARMLDGQFVKKFRAAQRPGAYTRVIETGTIAAGDAVAFLPADDRSFTLLDMFNLYYDRSAPSDAFNRGLDFPIAERARAEYERLAAG